MKHLFLIILLSVSTYIAQAQTTYVQSFDQLPDTLEYRGVAIAPFNGVPAFTVADNQLHIETSDEVANYFHRPYSFWIVKFDSLLNLTADEEHASDNALFPTVSVKMKSTETCYVLMTLMAAHPLWEFGSNTDKNLNGEQTPDHNLYFEIPGDGEWHTYYYNFNNEFQDYFGGMAGNSLGLVDSTQILGIRFKLNHGYTASWAYKGQHPTGVDSVYNHPFGFGYDEENGRGAKLQMKDLTIGVEPCEKLDLGDDIRICEDNGPKDIAISANVPGGTWTKSGDLNLILDSDVHDAGFPVNSNSLYIDSTNGGQAATLTYTAPASAYCVAQTDSIKIAYKNEEIALDLQNNVNHCNGTAAISALVERGAQFSWTQTTGPDLTFDPKSYELAFENLAIGSYTFVAHATCGSNERESPYNFDIYAKPVPPDAGPDIYTCDDQDFVQLTANDVSPGTGRWRQLSTNYGNLSDPDDANAIYEIHTNDDELGSIKYEWQSISEQCGALTDEVEIFINTGPGAISAGSDISSCSENTTLSASEPSQGTGHWTSNCDHLIFSNANSAHSMVEGLMDNTTCMLIWSVEADPECGVSRDTIILSHVEPIAPFAIHEVGEICTYDTIDLSLLNNYVPNTENGELGTWYHTGTGNFSVSGTANSNELHERYVPNDADAGLESLSFIYEVANTMSTNCASERDTIEVQLIRGPSQAVAGADIDACNPPVQLNAHDPEFGTGTWTTACLHTTLSAINDPQTNVDGLQKGDQCEFVWTVSTANGCRSSEDRMTVNIASELTEAKISTSSASICVNSTVTLEMDNKHTPNTSIGEIATWSTDGDADFIQSGSNTSTNLTEQYQPNETDNNNGHVRIYLTISNTNTPSCGITTDTIQIEILDGLPQPTATVEWACTGPELAISAQSAATEQGFWTINGYSTSNNATPSITDSNAIQTTVVFTEMSPFDYGEVTMQWTSVAGNCQATSAPAIGRIMGMREQSIQLFSRRTDECDSLIRLDGIPRHGPSFEDSLCWFVNGEEVYRSRTLSFESNDLVEGDIVKVIFKYNYACPVDPTPSDSIEIWDHYYGARAYAGIDQEICEDSARMAADLRATGESGTWRIISGSATINDVNDPNILITEINKQEPLLLEWIVNSDASGRCIASDTDYVEIRHKPLDDCIVASDPESNESGIYVYPNPVHDLMYVQGPQATFNFEILDAKGNKVFSGTGSGDTPIESGDLTPGYYILKINAVNTSLFTSFVKE